MLKNLPPKPKGGPSFSGKPNQADARAEAIQRRMNKGKKKAQ